MFSANFFIPTFNMKIHFTIKILFVRKQKKTNQRRFVSNQLLSCMINRYVSGVFALLRNHTHMCLVWAQSGLSWKHVTLPLAVMCKQKDSAKRFLFYPS